MADNGVMDGLSDAVTIRRVFGEPIERDGATIVPVAVVMGGGGGGGRDADGERPAESGGGFGVWARPIGVYVLRDGDARFRPAIDVLPLALVAFLFVRMIARARNRG